jgi:AcrR family transcriptional regulator
MDERSFMKKARAEALNRKRILRAAAALFSRRGFHGTSTRDIARKAGVSLGNIYNHFPDKERLFSDLLDDCEAEYFRPEQPLMRVFRESRFPDNIAAIGEATRETVERFPLYMRLIYVDMVEFNARHTSRLFSRTRERYARLFDAPDKAPRLAEGVDPAAALMTVTFGFSYFFIMEKLFNARNHYGMNDAEAIRHFTRIYERGTLPEKTRRPANA